MHVLQIIPRLSLDEALIKSPIGERCVRGGKKIEIGLLQKYRNYYRQVPSFLNKTLQFNDNDNIYKRRITRR